MGRPLGRLPLFGRLLSRSLGKSPFLGRPLGRLPLFGKLLGRSLSKSPFFGEPLPLDRAFEFSTLFLGMGLMCFFDFFC